jgi:hypothetical protein
MCPSCGSPDIHPLPNQELGAMVITRYHCNGCHRIFESGPIQLPPAAHQHAHASTMMSASSIVGGCVFGPRVSRANVESKTCRTPLPGIKVRCARTMCDRPSGHSRWLAWRPGTWPRRAHDRVRTAGRFEGLSFSRRCTDEVMARFVANELKQDHVNAGWTEDEGKPESRPPPPGP